MRNLSPRQNGPAAGVVGFLFLLISCFLSSGQNQPLPDLPDSGTNPIKMDPLNPLDPLPSLPDPVKIEEKRNRKVVIIRDDESWYFDSFAERVKSELAKLAIDSYELEIEDHNAKGDISEVERVLNQSLADESTDLILAAGYVVTARALNMTDAERTKPVLGGAVEFSEMLAGSISKEGTSKVANYSFITNPQRVAADIEALRNLSEQRTIYALVDRSLYRASGRSTELNEERREVESRYGVNIVILPVGETVDSIMSSIPSSAKAIYLAILPTLAPDQRTVLFKRLAKRGYLTLSMAGLPDVRMGAFASLAPDNGDAIAKRAALNAHQILLGIDPQILPVYLPVEDRLIINRQAAELAGWYPNYEIALTAEFLDETNRERGEEITLEKAMRMASCGNVDVQIQKEQEVISREDLRQAESFKRPTVTLNLQQSFTDYVDPISPFFTPDHLHAGSYGLELRQVLFNDTIRSNIGSALESVAAEKLNTRSQQLDAMESAGVAFLNYLSARSLWKIQRENLRLTENNLQLAKLRVNIGAAEAAETYRWEQDAASSRALVFQRNADRENARIELNRIVGAPRDQHWRFTDIELADDNTYFMKGALNRHIRYEDDAHRFGDFLKKVAIPASPELAAFDYGLSSQGIQLERIERSFFLPEVSAVFNYNRTSQATDRLDFSTQGERLGGVFLSLPLYEGGFREAEKAGQKAVIRQLALQRERALQLIEQRALTAFNGLFSEHPNIKLSRRALVAAEKNYEAVREKYSKGAATILDLLDAQSALLRQRQQASVAVYSYLQNVVQMQRAIAWFEFEKKGFQKDQWEGMLSTYMKRAVLEVPCSVKPDRNKDEIENRAVSVISASTNCPPPVVHATPVVETETETVPEQSHGRNGLLRKIFTNKK